jgi:hypothetical protein
MSAQDSAQFCIYDPNVKGCVWVQLNEAGHPFTVTSADPAGDAVTLQCADGRLLKLALREAKVAPMAPDTVPQPAGGNSLAQSAAQVGGPSNQREKRRTLPEERAAAAERYRQSQASGTGAAARPAQ